MRAALACVVTALALAAPAGAFDLGVASGDVRATSAVLWTRADHPGPVTLFVFRADGARKADLRRIQLRADPSRDLTVSARAVGLAPGTDYRFSFLQSGKTSRLGSFLTAPAPGVSETVRFAWSGDSDGAVDPDTGRPAYGAFEGLRRRRPTCRPSCPPRRHDLLGRGLRPAGPDRRRLPRPLPAEPPDRGPPRAPAGDAVRLDLGRPRGAQRLGAGHRSPRPARRRDARLPRVPAARPRPGPTPLPLLPLGPPPRGLHPRHAELPLAGRTERLYAGGWRPRSVSFLPQPARDAAAGLFPQVAEPPRPLSGRPESARPGLSRRHASSPGWNAASPSLPRPGRSCCTPEPIQELPLPPYDRWEGYPAAREALLRFVAERRIANVVWLAADAHATMAKDVVLDGRSTGMVEVVTGPIGTRTMGESVAQAGGPAAAALLTTLLRTFGARCAIIDRFSYGLVEAGARTLVVTPRNAGGAGLCARPVRLTAR